MLSGVTIERPETVSIDAQVRVGTDTVIEPFARLLGATHIGEDCRIGAGAILENADAGRPACTVQPVQHDRAIRGSRPARRWVRSRGCA